MFGSSSGTLVVVVVDEGMVDELDVVTGTLDVVDVGSVVLVVVVNATVLVV